MKKILIFTSIEGHLSLAKAIKEILIKANFEVKITDVWTTDNKNAYLYLPFYRYFPSLFKIPYKLGEYEAISKATKMIAEKWLTKEVKEEIKCYKPDLIICTYGFYLPSLEKILDYQKDPLPIINLISNPWTIHNLELSHKMDYHLVYDEKSRQIVQKYKIKPENIIPSGWFTQSKFYKKTKISPLYKQFGFNQQYFTLLICGGSEGSNMILKIIPALITSPKPLQVIVACGTNNFLYKTLKATKKMLYQLKNIPKINHLIPKLNLKIIRFTEGLPKYIQMANLVVGKAGPNLLFETTACKKPFFAICHIAGQEDGNLKLIRKKGLGIVEENPVKAIRLLRKIINQPAILKKFSQSIAKERFYNLQAEKKLLTCVKTLLH